VSHICAQLRLLRHPGIFLGVSHRFTFVELLGKKVGSIHFLHINGRVPDDAS